MLTKARAQLGVFHYGFPGVIKLAEGAFEAVVVYVYIKGLRHGDTVTFRGFMFAQVCIRAYGGVGAAPGLEVVHACCALRAMLACAGPLACRSNRVLYIKPCHNL